MQISSDGVVHVDVKTPSNFCFHFLLRIRKKLHSHSLRDLPLYVYVCACARFSILFANFSKKRGEIIEHFGECIKIYANFKRWLNQNDGEEEEEDSNDVKKVRSSKNSVYFVCVSLRVWVIHFLCANLSIWT